MKTSILKKFIVTNAAMLLAFILVFTFALIPAAAEEAETTEATDVLTTGADASEETAKEANGGLSEKSVKAIVSAIGCIKSTVYYALLFVVALFLLSLVFRLSFHYFLIMFMDFFLGFLFLG